MANKVKECPDYSGLLHFIRSAIYDFGQGNNLLLPANASHGCLFIKLKHMRLSLPIFLTLLASSILVGCYPKGPENYTDFDLVYTNFSDSFDFAQLKTFALPDSIIKIT